MWRLSGAACVALRHGRVAVVTKGRLRIPRELRWTVVAAGVVGGSLTPNLACGPTVAPDMPVCVGLVDGSLQTLPIDAASCPDGDIRTVV